MLSGNDDVTTTTPPGCRPLNRKVYKIAHRRFQMASLLIAVIFRSSFDSVETTFLFFQEENIIS